ncbi:recombinase family protein [Streptomyces sp. SID5770]|uniref:recombinase family protein n=1 Tax=Streptomyces sp. SID5770 TaxID=2690308 RepID=UPI0013692AFB|nr:recombinase family protein [Streptomyces sp. SID5770]MZE53833.1 recombinase family protein [Streptomyces sp. SID5770]MZE56478.1 recombinase family protein [Streptomyces sp. SID5770]
MPEHHDPYEYDDVNGRRIIRCYAYARISEDREGAGLGVERQHEDIDELAAQLTTRDVEYRIVRRFQDNDLSAYTGKPRPDYLAMLAALRAGEGDCVLAWHTDRLHRSPAELEEYIDVCEPRRIDTRTVKAGHLDLTTATGRMIARQLGVQARYEIERMIERQKRARVQKVSRGEYCGGPRPYGYESDGTTLVPEEAEALRDAADAFLAGASLRSIAADMNRRGLKTSTGADWEGESLARVLKRPRNAGLAVLQGKEVGTAAWPAVIEEATWRSMAAILADPSRTSASSTALKHLGSGLYLCGKCGATMKSGTKGAAGRGMHVYKCRVQPHVSRKMSLIDDLVQVHVLERLARPDAADMFAVREPTVDVEGARRTMREARAMLTDLAAALGAGEMDMSEWRAASQAAKKRLAKADADLSSAVAVNPVAGLVVADDIGKAWSDFDLSRRRAVIDYLVTVTVLPAQRGRRPGGGYVDPDAVRIDWK